MIFLLLGVLPQQADAIQMDMIDQMIGLKNDYFVSHDGSLFPSFNPALLSNHKGKSLMISTFYRKMGAILNLKNESTSNYYEETKYSHNNFSINFPVYLISSSIRRAFSDS